MELYSVRKKNNETAIIIEDRSGIENVMERGK